MIPETQLSHALRPRMLSRPSRIEFSQAREKRPLTFSVVMSKTSAPPHDAIDEIVDHWSFDIDAAEAVIERRPCDVGADRLFSQGGPIWRRRAKAQQAYCYATPPAFLSTPATR